MVRAVAIMLVMIEHFGRGLGDKIAAGYYGVNLFFVLSGFLITQSLWNQEQSFHISLFEFYKKRLLRIIPAYFLMIGLVFVFFPAFINGVVRDCLLFYYNYSLANRHLNYTGISHIWSLCVEMQFYLIWPFIIFSLKNHKKWLIGLLLVLAIFSWLQFYFNIIFSLQAYRWVGLPSNIYSFSIGAFVFITKDSLFSNIKENKRKMLIVLTGCLIILSLLTHHWSRFVCLPVLSALMIGLLSSSSNMSINLKTNPMSYCLGWLGRISYSLYLFHLPVYFGFKVWWDTRPFCFSFTALSVISILIASISFFCVEKPFIQLGSITKDDKK